MAAIAWALKNWKLIAIGAVLAGVALWHWNEVRKAANAAREKVIIEQTKEGLDRAGKANDADIANSKCSLDPECLRKTDGWRRD